MRPMKTGERAVHAMRSELGIGRVTHFYGDGRCDLVFDGVSFSGIPLSSVHSVEAELVLAELDGLLADFKYDQASANYVDHYQPYLSEPEFRDRLAKAVSAQEAARIASERARLLGELDGLLDRNCFDQADQHYLNQCCSWYSRLAYDDRRAIAVRSNEIVEAYAGSSLQELDSLYLDWGDPRFAPAEFAQMKVPKVLLRMARLGMPLDEEQLLACARPERHRLIRARAGSGKTRTLAAIAALSIHDESLTADQVLVLAFNKKAAREIGDRVRSAAGVAEFRNARTFHSLAWHLADHADRSLIFDDGNLEPSRQKQVGFVERILASIMNPAFREFLYEFFRRELEQLDRLGSGLSGQEYLTFRRAMTNYTLGGDAVKSNGEKFVADFLFEHGIEYAYEKVYSWSKDDRLQGGIYRPDFSILHSGKDYVLEHWAIDPDSPYSQLPSWWEMSARDYRSQILDKRAFWADRGVRLIETHTGMLTQGREAFEARLRDLLEEASILCHKLPHYLLVERVASAPRNVSRMSGLFLQFISRAKKRGWSVDAVAAVVGENPDPEPRNRVFHEMAIRAYAAYAEQLTDEQKMDFDDLLVSAAETVGKRGGTARLKLDRNQSIALSDLRWVLIDEFQDFSELYYRLIDAILQANPSIRVTAVGDDWQAINGFAGAQLTFFERFDEFFPGAGEATITMNRRSGRAIVDSGNQLMWGKGRPARASKDFDGEITLVCVDKVWPEDGSIYLQLATTEREQGRLSVSFELARALKACVDCIVESIYVDAELGLRWMPRILLLARTSRAYNLTLSDFRDRLVRALRLRSDLPELANFSARGGRPNDDAELDLIQAMTAHKAKGKEADTVIVLQATANQFPLVHADNQLFGPFGVDGANVLAEERRLFYVAVTRAEYRLMLLTETGNMSPYIAEMVPKDRAQDPAVDGSVSATGDIASRIALCLGASDQQELIRRNISPQALRAWSELQSAGLGVPTPGYSLSGSLQAELAWPDACPPTAILTGTHERFADQWRARGWLPVVSPVERG